MKTQKVKASVGGWIQDTLEDRDVIFLSKIKKCVEALLGLTLYKFGDMFLEQLKGIPIGGPISGIILRIVLLLLFIFWCFAIWFLGSREHVQNVRGGSGSISGYREPHSDNLFVFDLSGRFPTLPT